MPAGRPSKFGTLDLAKVEKLAQRGWKDDEMAEFFGVNPDTWHEWKKVHPEFSEALRDWKIEADSRVERSLYERATGYSHPEDKIFREDGETVVVRTTKHYPPDSTSIIFWLKNRDKDRWRDKQEHEHTGKDGGPIEVANLSDVERAQRLAALAAKATETK